MSGRKEGGEDGGAQAGCGRARELLLEAAPRELRGEGQGALAAHLSRCPDCRAAARTLLEGQEELDQALARMASAGTSVDQVLASLRRERVAPGTKETVELRTPGRGSWIRWASLAAAAALAGVLAWAPWDGPGRRPAGGEEVGGREARVVEPPEGGLRVEADRRFALMKTDDPGISVVWFY